MELDFLISSAAIYLATWRLERRFGLRGIGVFLLILAFLGPWRDYQYMARFPEWGAAAPGVAPVLAISATYVLLIVIGQWVMNLVAGRAPETPLAQRPWEGRTR